MLDKETELNLCDEIVKEFRRQNLTDDEIEKVISHDIFQNAYYRSSVEQRAMLTTLLFKMLLSLPVAPPSQIRIYLNSASSVLSWLEDIKLSVLPFIAINKDKVSFFY